VKLGGGNLKEGQKEKKGMCLFDSVRGNMEREEEGDKEIKKVQKDRSREDTLVRISTPFL